MVADETPWHVLHLFLRVEGNVPASARARLAAAAAGVAGEGIAQSSVWGVLGARADLGVMLLGPEAKDLHHWQATLFHEAEGSLGRSYGFASLTEVSEYVPAERRSAELVENRLHPKTPDLPFVSFYPMSKRREKDRNWFRLSFEDRSRLMHGHGMAARKYSGKIQQIITTAFGLDDWEWGVTLFGRSSQDIRDCVHEMRFDEGSAEYAEFGPFYFGPRLDRARMEALLHSR